MIALIVIAVLGYYIVSVYFTILCLEADGDKIIDREDINVAFVFGPLVPFVAAWSFAGDLLHPWAKRMRTYWRIRRGYWH